MLDYNMEENAGLITQWESTVKDQTVSVICHVEKISQEFAVLDGEIVFSKWLHKKKMKNNSITQMVQFNKKSQEKDTQVTEWACLT